jgi:hypothetical protein
MNREAEDLRADIEHYRKLLKLIGDKVAIETLEFMLAEKEKRLLSIEAGRLKGG